MADIKNIDVFQTVTSVSFEVEPNTNIININKVTTSGYSGVPNLQEVTDIGAITTNPVTANSFIKSGGTGLNALLDNGSTVALSTIGGATNLSPTQTATNFTINSDTGTDATIPLGNGTLAGATINDYTNTEKNKLGKYPSTATNGKILQGNGTSYVEIDTPTGTTNLGYTPSPTNGTVTSSTGDDATIPLADSTNAGLFTPSEKSKLSGIATGAEVNVNADWNAVSGDAQILNKPTISGSNTGDQDLQSVTTLGASTSNPIVVNVVGASTGINSTSQTGIGVNGSSDSGIGVEGFSGTGIGVKGYSETGIAGSFDTDSTTANIANFKKAGIVKAFINNAGELTAQKLIKQGGFDYQFLKADGSVDNNIYLTSADLPATLDLYATTTASDISGYTVLVRNIADTRYNTTAVDVSTGVITSVGQLVGSLVTDANIISGNPGVFDFKTIGNISRTNGTGQAEFFFRIYKRNLAGTETLIAESDYTLPVTNGGYVEFSATALWNDGIFLETDRVVLKYYANRLASPVGSDPTYQFQFGGASPVRSSAAIPTSVMPNIYLRDLADVENVDALNNEILYWNDPASLWEHSLAENLVPLATAAQKGLVSTTTQTFAGDKTFTGTIGASNLSNTNTGDETITTIKTKLGITTLSGSNTGDQDLSGYAPLASPAFTGNPTATTQTPLNNSTRLATTAYVEAACAVVAGSGGVTVSPQDTFGTANIATVTASQYAAFVTAGTVSSTTLYFITA